MEKKRKGDDDAPKVVGRSVDGRSVQRGGKRDGWEGGREGAKR